MRYLVILSILALMVGCHPEAEKPPLSGKVATVALELVPVEVISGPSFIPITGLVKAERQGQVAAQVMGNVVSIPVALGSKVKEGEVLVRLSSPELEARLAQAQASLHEVERAYHVEAALLAKGASTSDMVSNLQDRFHAMQSNLAAIQATVNQLTLKAPFAGVVTNKSVDVGDLASPGRILVEVQSQGKLEVELAVATALPVLPLGFEVVLDFNGNSERAMVKEISAAADTQSSRRRVILNVEGRLLTSGSTVTVYWPSESRRRILIPATAWQRHGQLERVWVVNDAKKLEMRLVRVAGSEKDKVEVVSGLSGQEILVVKPTSDLIEGLNVAAR
jgi:RND family efflux transporter MFP subunit